MYTYVLYIFIEYILEEKRLLRNKYFSIFIF